MDRVTTIPNPELEVVNGKGRWNNPDHRREGFHTLHWIARYGISLRAARVMLLEKCIDTRIADLAAVRHLTFLPSFSAMIVTRGQQILFERYASDFTKDKLHSLQSITKTTMNLIVGRLLEQGVLDLSCTIAHYLPEIGSGYAGATLQQVLDMDVVNDYSENFADPRASYYLHEEAMGWRLPRNSEIEETQHRFLVRIASSDTRNNSGHAQYKCANADVIGWVVERVSGRPLRSFLADIVDAAGLEHALHITTDREGIPSIDGGACLTARDLARYLTIFVRRGRGVAGEMVGSGAFIDQTLVSGVPMPHPYEWVRYSNNTMVAGRSLGHGGWGGQYAVANVDTGTTGVFFSVVEDQNATGRDYQVAIMRMLESITSMGT